MLLRFPNKPVMMSEESWICKSELCMRQKTQGSQPAGSVCLFSKTSGAQIGRHTICNRRAHGNQSSANNGMRSGFVARYPCFRTQGEIKRRAQSGFRISPDPSRMLMDNSLHGSKPDSRPFEIFV